MVVVRFPLILCCLFGVIEGSTWDKNRHAVNDSTDTAWNVSTWTAGITEAKAVLPTAALKDDKTTPGKYKVLKTVTDLPVDYKGPIKYQDGRFMMDVGSTSIDGYLVRDKGQTLELGVTVNDLTQLSSNFNELDQLKLNFSGTKRFMDIDIGYKNGEYSFRCSEGVAVGIGGSKTDSREFRVQIPSFGYATLTVGGVAISAMIAYSDVTGTLITDVTQVVPFKFTVVKSAAKFSLFFDAGKLAIVDPNFGKGTNTAAVIGGSVGGVLAGIAVIACVVFLVWYCSKERREKRAAEKAGVHGQVLKRKKSRVHNDPDYGSTGNDQESSVDRSRDKKKKYSEDRETEQDRKKTEAKKKSKNLKVDSKLDKPVAVVASKEASASKKMDSTAVNRIVAKQVGNAAEDYPEKRAAKDVAVEKVVAPSKGSRGRKVMDKKDNSLDATQEFCEPRDDAIDLKLKMASAETKVADSKPAVVPEDKPKDGSIQASKERVSQKKVQETTVTPVEKARVDGPVEKPGQEAVVSANVAKDEKKETPSSGGKKPSSNVQGSGRKGEQQTGAPRGGSKRKDAGLKDPPEGEVRKQSAEREGEENQGRQPSNRYDRADVAGGASSERKPIDREKEYEDPNMVRRLLADGNKIPREEKGQKKLPQPKDTRDRNNAESLKEQDKAMDGQGNMVLADNKKRTPSQILKEYEERYGKEKVPVDKESGEKLDKANTLTFDSYKDKSANEPIKDKKAKKVQDKSVDDQDNSGDFENKTPSQKLRDDQDYFDNDNVSFDKKKEDTLDIANSVTFDHNKEKASNGTPKNKNVNKEKKRKTKKSPKKRK